MDGIAGANLRRLKAVISAYPETACIVLMDQGDLKSVVDVFRMGARGVFSCSESDIEMLRTCIQRVLEGGIWVDSEHLRYVVSALSTPTRDAPARSLTPSEEQVVRHVAEGLRNREIASVMNLRREHRQQLHFPRVREARALESGRAYQVRNREFRSSVQGRDSRH